MYKKWESANDIVTVLTTDESWFRNEGDQTHPSTIIENIEYWEYWILWILNIENIEGDQTHPSTIIETIKRKRRSHAAFTCTVSFIYWRATLHPLMKCVLRICFWNITNYIIIMNIGSLGNILNIIDIGSLGNICISSISAHLETFWIL